MLPDAEIKHLIKMVDQITANLARGEDEEADAAKVAEHLQRFWSSGMRARLANYIAQDEDAHAQLHKVSALAVTRATT